MTETVISQERRKRARPKAWIDADACSGCMVCSEVCPVGCISKRAEEIYPYHVYGHCMMDAVKCT